VLNARIRKRWRMERDFPIAVIGENADMRFDYTYLGAGPETLTDLIGGSHAFLETLKNAERPMIVVGQGALARADGLSVLAHAVKLADAIGAVTEEWNGFGVIHTAASRVGALDLGFVPGEGGKTAAEMLTGTDVLFLLGADEIDVAPGGFVVYIGTHGDRGAHRADVILPGAAYPEKSGLYANTEGRVQLANRAAFPPGDAREDWAILRALSDVLGAKLPYDSLAGLRELMFAAHPHFMRLGEITAGDPADVNKLAALGGTPGKTPFTSAVTDFYLTNPIARASAVMAECSALAHAAAKTAAE
jgi:NADH-quinone oxidoreductase subunit G